MFHRLDREHHARTTKFRLYQRLSNEVLPKSEFGSFVVELDINEDSDQKTLHLIVSSALICVEIEDDYVIEDDDGATCPSTTILYPFPGNMDNHFVLGKILRRYRPRFVVLYDAALTFCSITRGKTVHCWRLSLSVRAQDRDEHNSLVNHDPTPTNHQGTQMTRFYKQQSFLIDMSALLFSRINNDPLLRWNSLVFILNVDDEEGYNTVARTLSCLSSRMFLIRMPGVTFKNYKLIMNQVENLRALSRLSESELTTIMGNSKQTALLDNFIHEQRGDLVSNIKSATSSSIWLILEHFKFSSSMYV